ncbi:MAG TPA: trypsin-like peptidase domain-containing protein, partial [Acetobacteraceae bacterium]|nr:trypsin-like peptidase domain-containing protein [Acetobacteraceae bacterium]
MTRDDHGKRRHWRLTLAAALLAGTALGGYAAGHDVFAAGPATTQGQTTTQNGAIQPVPSSHLIPDFADLVAQVKPAVVSITTHLKQVPADMQGEQIPLPFRQFFPFAPQQQEAVEARGSGFIISADGLVVTNNHVVKDAKSVYVTLDDGTNVKAKIIGTDPKTDLALLRVHADHKLPFLQLGNSNDVRVGQWVVAVGNPYGLGGTVTAGIVSARGRDIGDGPYDSFIQIDAPINRGNSGGPLFTQDGKVIGVNTAILSPTGGSIGIGFAIPSNTVKTVVAALEKNGHVTRGYLGVEAQPL